MIGSGIDLSSEAGGSSGYRPDDLAVIRHLQEGGRFGLLITYPIRNWVEMRSESPSIRKFPHSRR
jgi:hypothetical protein